MPTRQFSNYVFFGSADFSVYILDEMKKLGFVPGLIITTPDKPKGRTLVLSQTPVKVWGEQHGVPVLDPAKLDGFFVETLNKEIDAQNSLFVVAAYGKIIPQAVLEIPAYQTLNIHPSLLPHYRGAAPIHAAMLDDVKDTGVTIMRIDALMDHGPILAQKKITIAEWPTYEALEEMMAREGAALLAAVIPDWIDGKIKEREQDHGKATFTKKISKEDGRIDARHVLDPAAAPAQMQYEIFRKIQAYHVWPSAYFFIEKKSNAAGSADIVQKIRVKITDAAWQDGRLVIKKVIPEGKPEIDFALFRKNV